jgi:hypothetical protein
LSSNILFPPHSRFIRGDRWVVKVILQWGVKDATCHQVAKQIMEWDYVRGESTKKFQQMNFLSTSHLHISFSPHPWCIRGDSAVRWGRRMMLGVWRMFAGEEVRHKKSWTHQNINAKMMFVVKISPSFLSTIGYWCTQEAAGVGWGERWPWCKWRMMRRGKWGEFILVFNKSLVTKPKIQLLPSNFCIW